MWLPCFKATAHDLQEPEMCCFGLGSPLWDKASHIEQTSVPLFFNENSCQNNQAPLLHEGNKVWWLITVELPIQLSSPPPAARTTNTPPLPVFLAEMVMALQ